MNLPSLKKILIQKYAFLTTSDELRANNLILLTAAGTIIGKMILDDPENQDTSSDNLISKISAEFATQYRTDNGIGDEEYLTGNDGFICLKDVQVISGVKTTNLPFLAVFYDEIIAATLGNIS
ncbi:MAG: hypothetical protein RSC33_07215 [Vagococcus sp.]